MADIYDQHRAAFPNVSACLDDSGFHWERRLEKEGFAVWQAV